MDQRCGDLRGGPSCVPTDDNRPCRRRSCTADALDDSDFCEAHEEAKKARRRLTMRTLRKLRRKLKQCRDCGKRALDGMRCSACRIKHGRFKAGAGVVAAGVAGARADRVASATRVSSLPGEEGRTRNHGKQARGKPSAAMLNEDDLNQMGRDFVDARLAMTAAWDKALDQLPRIQREEARAAARGKFALFLREGVAVFVRIGGDPMELLPHAEP